MVSVSKNNQDNFLILSKLQLYYLNFLKRASIHTLSIDQAKKKS